MTFARRRASLISELIARSKLKRATIYKRRMLWLDQLSIDILVPCGFYRDLLFYGPNNVMVAAFEAIAGTLPLGNGYAPAEAIRQGVWKGSRARRGRHTTTTNLTRQALTI